MWKLNRRCNHAVFSFLLRTHLNLSSFRPPHFVNSIGTSELSLSRTKMLTGPMRFACPSMLSSSFSSSSSRNPSTHMVGSENGDDGDGDGDDDSEDDGDGDMEVGQSGIRDENLSQDAQAILGVLRDFGNSGPEAKQKLEQCSITASSELVIEVLCQVRNHWEAAFTFFLWAGKQPGYAHSVREYHSMISILGKARKFDTAWALIDEMRGGRTGPSLVTPQTLLIMIRKYSAVHDVGKAINTFYALKRFKFKVGIEEFQDLLSALCRYKNVDDAEHLLFCNENVFPFETKSFNIILNGWCNMIVSLNQANRFWREMGKRGIQHDAVSYSSMISCYSKAGNVHGVLKLFNQIKELGIAPDLKVYNAVIYALAKGKLVKEAHDLMKSMEDKGFVPNTVTYNSLIKPLCRARRSDEAKMFFEEMFQRGLHPSIRTYHAFFRILKTGEEVFKLLDKMKKMGCHPTNDTYIMLIRKFCRWRQLENVFKLWSDIGENGLSPDRSSYIVLIHGLFLNGKLEEAYKYYEEMKNKGFLPEPKTEEMLQTWICSKKTTEWQSSELKGNSSKNTEVDSNTSGYERDFLRQPETRRVTRERGFSFWE